MPHFRDIFVEEHQKLEKAKKYLQEKEQLTEQQLWERYAEICQWYEELLNDSTVIASIGDRFQKRLEKNNDQLQEQAQQISHINAQLAQRNDLLEKTIEELTRTKISKKATTIVLAVAVVLFILSEGVIEPLIETQTQSYFLGFAAKGAIALLLRPIDYLVERYLILTNMRKKSAVNPNNFTIF